MTLKEINGWLFRFGLPSRKFPRQTSRWNMSTPCFGPENQRRERDGRSPPRVAKARFRAEPNSLEILVGAVRFELTTSCTRNKRATRLRYAPNRAGNLPTARDKCNEDFSAGIF